MVRTLIKKIRNFLASPQGGGKFLLLLKKRKVVRIVINGKNFDRKNSKTMGVKKGVIACADTGATIPLNVCQYLSLNQCRQFIKHIIQKKTVKYSVRFLITIHFGRL
jgi:hypothetical protein